MQIDFNRFASSQRYCSTVPLDQLALRVRVTRALIVEENHVETVVDAVIPWNGKLFSPSEQIRMWDKMRDIWKRTSHAGSEGDAAASTARSSSSHHTRDPHNTALAAEHLALLPGQGATTTSSDPSEHASVRSLFHCPSPLELLEELSRPASWLFTRPSGEDYIDVREEECPVLPSQGDSRLAPVILRRHRQEHLPNNNFFVVWADGITTGRTPRGAVVTASGAGTTTTVNRKGNSVKSRRRTANLTGGGDGPDWTAATELTLSGATAAGAPLGLHSEEAGRRGGGDITATTSTEDIDREDLALMWEGEEYVFCTVTMEQQEGYFTAKPTLFEEHTLRVDSSHIYRFCIEAQLKAAPASSTLAVVTEVPTLLQQGPQPERTSTRPPSTQGKRDSQHGRGSAAQLGQASKSQTGMLAAHRTGQPSVVLPGEFSAFAAGIHANVLPASPTPGSPTQRSMLGSPTGGAAGGAGWSSTVLPAPAPEGGGADEVAPITRKILKAVAQTVPRGAQRVGENARALHRRRPLSSGDLDGSGSGALVGERAPGTTDDSSSDLHTNASLGAPSIRAVRFGVSRSLGEVSSTVKSRYFVFGVVERCVGIAESTLFIRGEVYRGMKERGLAGLLSRPHRSGVASDDSGTGETHLTFCSQLAYAGTVREIDYSIAEPEHIFNMPFECEYLEDSPVLPGSSSSGGLGGPTTPLRLAVGLFTEGFDGVGIQSACGYACISIPVLSPGSHQLRCPVWSIRKTGRELLKNTVVGGAPSFINLRQSGPFPEVSPGSMTLGTGIGVKEGLVSESAGFVYLHVNVLSQRVR